MLGNLSGLTRPRNGAGGAGGFCSWEYTRDTPPQPLNMKVTFGSLTCSDSLPSFVQHEKRERLSFKHPGPASYLGFSSGPCFP